MPPTRDDARPSAEPQPPQPRDTAPAAGDDDTDIEGTPGLGENQAGFLKDRDGMGTGRNGNKG